MAIFGVLYKYKPEIYKNANLYAGFYPVIFVHNHIFKKSMDLFFWAFFVKNVNIFFASAYNIDSRIPKLPLDIAILTEVFYEKRASEL